MPDALLTDFYQLTMLHAYFRARMDERGSTRAAW
jgi:hypothetical protein